MIQQFEATIEDVERVGYVPGVSDPLIPGAGYYESAPTEWLTRHLGQLAEIRKVQPAVVFLGDSITKGWLGVGLDAWNGHFASAPAFSLGIDGDRAQHVHWRIDEGVLDGITPSVLVVMVGINNLWYDADRFGLDRVKEALRKLGLQLREKQPNAVILQLSVLPALPDPDHSVRRDVVAVNAFLRDAVAEFGAEFIDLTDLFQDANGVIDVERMPDHVHPSALGYELIAERLVPRIDAALGRSKRLVLEDFRRYVDDAALARQWYTPKHGGEVRLGLADDKLRVDFTTEPIEGRHYCAICRLNDWRVEADYDALEFWVQPDGSGHDVNIELNMAKSPRPETHDLFGHTIKFELGDTKPCVVTIPLASLTRPKWQAGLGLYPDFRLGDVFEVAFYFGGNRERSGPATYHIGEIALVNTSYRN